MLQSSTINSDRHAYKIYVATRIIIFDYKILYFFFELISLWQNLKANQTNNAKVETKVSNKIRREENG